MIACTPDAEYRGTNYPYAVREWCINAAAVNPETKSVFAPSEDGHLYRWDMAANSLSEAVKLSPGIGEPYVPTIISPDGTVITLNGGTLFAVGSLSNMGIMVLSSAPDLRGAIASDSITFAAVVTNLTGLDPIPTGSVTFQDSTWHGITPVTNTFASAVPLSNGVASVTTTSLTADTNNFGNYLIAVVYSGDATFPGGSATLVQKVHPRTTATTLTSAQVGSSNAVVFASTTASIGPTSAKPSGMVTFWDGSGLVKQIPIKTNGVATFTNANFGAGSHAMTVTYASDTMFAASAAAIVPNAPLINGRVLPDSGAFQLTFTNAIGAGFSVLGSSGPASPMTNWTLLGPAIETSPGSFKFIDPALTKQRLYEVRSP